MAGVSALLMTVLLAAAVAGAVAIMLLLSVGLVRLEAARQARSSTCGRQLHSAAWANQAWRPADDCLEWCLIGATGDDAEAHPSRRKPNVQGQEVITAG
jgi:hypothetical protein